MPRWKSRAIAGSATFTTVDSRKTAPDPRMDAASTRGPFMGQLYGGLVFAGESWKFPVRERVVEHGRDCSGEDVGAACAIAAPALRNRARAHRAALRAARDGGLRRQLDARRESHQVAPRAHELVL